MKWYIKGILHVLGYILGAVACLPAMIYQSAWWAFPWSVCVCIALMYWWTMLSELRHEP